MKQSLILLLLLPGFLMAQETVTKNMGKFDEIKVFNGISVRLVKGESGKVTITGANAEDVVLINRNGLLRVRMKTKKIFRGDETQVVIHFDKIDKIDANENAYVLSNDEIKTTTLVINAQEGAEVKVPINVDRLEAKAVSGGILDLKGRADVQDISVKAGGQFDAKDLISKQSIVVVSAGGSAKVFATDFADAKVRAGGRVEIYGNPKKVNKDTFMGGNILEMN
ncbi:MAG: head GIN domain-containing protein [Flavobacteriaceae bacterium]|nr:head GIN domain-containing protein [Flavobacteriaceae bacterium]